MADTSQHWGTIPAMISAAAALTSGLFAYLSRRSAVTSELRNKADETVVLGQLRHPPLRPEHAPSVLTCTIFNKSSRKVTIHNVKAYDRAGYEMQIAYGTCINQLGQPEATSALNGLVDQSEIYLRHEMGEDVDFCRLEVLHSFSDVAVSTIFDSAKEHGHD